MLDSFNSGNPIINGEEIVFQGQIVVLSSRRTSGHLRSLFKPRTLLVMFEYLWESNSQEMTGLIVNLYLNTFPIIDRFLAFLTVFLRNLQKPCSALFDKSTSKWTCSSFKSLARLSSRIKNCTPLPFRAKTYLNKFFI